MTLHKLSAGDGYTYLTRQVASADTRRAGQGLAGYYAGSGTPPGRWAGQGAEGLDLAGEVSEAQMRALFGAGLHPNAAAIRASLASAGVSAARTERAVRLGSAYPQYKTLDARGTSQRRAVAGYDLVFTPVKSVSVLWGLGDDRTRRLVEDAHHAAVADVLAWVERNGAFTRVGRRGRFQVDTHGLVAACFDHYESRSGDPDLHTHVAVANKVRATTDLPGGSPRWLALDGRALFAVGVAATERYNTRLEDELRARLGVRFVPRPVLSRRDTRAVREIAGVPSDLLEAFSMRRARILDAYADLESAYRAEHGHDPTPGTRLRLAQQATLATRDAKPEPLPLPACEPGGEPEPTASSPTRGWMPPRIRSPTWCCAHC